jgi:hypothetical protein
MYFFAVILPGVLLITKCNLFAVVPAGRYSMPFFRYRTHPLTSYEVRLFTFSENFVKFVQRIFTFSYEKTNS